MKPVYRGVFPVAPTVFDSNGELDLEGQKRCTDFMIDAGSTGLCILANFSEQFVLSDEEREILTATILQHVAGRVPVIVTTTHFGTKVCAERSRRAQDLGDVCWIHACHPAVTWRPPGAPGPAPLSGGPDARASEAAAWDGGRRRPGTAGSRPGSHAG